jgi:protein SCO1
VPKTIRFYIAIILVGLSGCRHSSANEKRYDLKGKVVAVEKDKRLVTVSHEDIKNYMPSMTMPFTIKDDWPLEVLRTGDTITATLVVDGSSSWLEGIVITQESADTSDPKGEGVGEAKAGDEVPNFDLVNQDGKRIRMNDYRGKALALTFIYTRCPLPEYCTLMSNNFAAIDRQLQKEPDLYQKTHLLSVSFDTDYDTPAVLKSYGAAHTGRYSDEKFDHWEFASGNADQVKGLAQFFGLRYFHDTQSGQEQIIHSLRTAVIAPDGKVFKVYRENKWKPEEIVEDLRQLSSGK